MKHLMILIINELTKNKNEVLQKQVGVLLKSIFDKFDRNSVRGVKKQTSNMELVYNLVRLSGMDELFTLLKFKEMMDELKINYQNQLLPLENNESYNPRKGRRPSENENYKLPAFGRFTNSNNEGPTSPVFGRHPNPNWIGVRGTRRQLPGSPFGLFPPSPNERSASRASSGLFPNSPPGTPTRREHQGTPPKKQKTKNHNPVARSLFGNK